MPRAFRNSRNAKLRSKPAKRFRPDPERITRSLAVKLSQAHRELGQIHSFTRSYNLAGNCSVDGSYCVAFGTQGFFSMNSSSSGPNYGWMQIYPQLFQVPASGDFTNLFDQFRITQFTVKLTPYCTVNDTTLATSLGTSSPGMLVHSIIDYDGSGAPISGTNDLTCLGGMRQERTYRMENFLTTRGKCYTVKCPAPGVQVDATNTGMIVNSPWLNQTNATKPHYGIIIMLEQFACAGVPSETLYFKAECTLNIECQGEI
jgi:hypothetical protein